MLFYVQDYLLSLLVCVHKSLFIEIYMGQYNNVIIVKRLSNPGVKTVITEDNKAE